MHLSSIRSLVLPVILLGLGDASAQEKYDCRSGIGCLNGGSCDVNTGECSCEAPFDGYDCGQDISAFELKYDCRVHGLGCLNGGSCDLNTGECSCEAPFDGYDCRQDTSVTCVKDCENGGICINDFGTVKCYCETYTGAACETNRMLLLCTPNDMTIKISPHIDASLKQFVSVTGIDDPGCRFSESAAEWSSTISNNECGMTTEENLTAKKRTRSVSYLLRYFEGADTSIDKVITWRCTESTDGASMETTVEMNRPLAPDPKMQINSIVSNEVPTAVIVSILDKWGNALDANAAYPLGTELQLVWDLDTRNYKDILVTDLSAFDDKFPLISNGCLTRFAGNILRSFEKTDKAIDGNLHKIIIFRFSLFRVVDDKDKLTLKTVFLVCEESATCAGPDCSTIGNAHKSYNTYNFGRRRRAVKVPQSYIPSNLDHRQHAVEDPETGKATLEVRIARDANKNGATDVKDTAKCVTTAGFLIPLFLLLVLLIIAVAFSCFFCMRAYRDRSELDKMKGRPYKH
jgi:hypothetical protein